MNILFNGKPLEVIEKIKGELISKINEINLNDENFECEGVEEITKDIDSYLEIINTIYQDLLIEYIDRNSFIFVGKNDNGELGYDKEEIEVI